MPVRDGADRQRRALPEHAPCDPRQPRQAVPALRRARPAGHGQRRVRLGLLVRGRLHHPRREPPGRVDPGPCGGDPHRRVLVHRARPDERRGLAPRPGERRALERHLRIPPHLHGRECPDLRAAGLDAGHLARAPADARDPGGARPRRGRALLGRDRPARDRARDRPRVPRGRAGAPARIRVAGPEARDPRAALSHTFRLFWTGWIFNVKNLTMSGFFILNATISPVFFATIAHYMFESGSRAGSLLYASLGAGMMGIWSSVLFGSGGLIQWQRWQGTLEYVIGVPPRLIQVVLPMTIATASIGLYSIASTLLWGRVIFGLPLDFAHPVWFGVSLVTGNVLAGRRGPVMSSTFVLMRNANSLSNLLEHPIWLVPGLLISLSLLPGWTRPISYVLAPTWGIKGLRDAALGGNPAPAVAACLVLGLLYLVIGHFTLGYFEVRARKSATLVLR